MARGRLHIWITAILMLAAAPMNASGQVLKLGDILVAEPGAAAVSMIDPASGTRTILSQGGLLLPAHKTVAVALARDGDVIALHRTSGLIRVNPVTGAQSPLSQGGHFRDPWAMAIDKDTGYIYVADSGYDNDRPEINEAGKIIRVDPANGAQVIIAAGTPCNVFSGNLPCLNTTSAGSYLSHPYGIAIDYVRVPGTLVVADMSAFNGKGAIVRIQPVPNGTQTLLWGPSSAVPAPQVAQTSPLGCPMGIAVEPNGNLLTTVFTYPVPASPIYPAPPGSYYGCAPPGMFRIDLVNNSQVLVNSNAPEWQSGHAYSVGDVIRDETSSTGRVHRVITAGVSQASTPNWNTAMNGTTADGTVVWRNIGRGGNWLIPFGVDVEPGPPSNPSAHTIIFGDEGHSMLFRLDASGQILTGGPLATELNNVTSVDVITFTPPGGFKTEPMRFNGQPDGILPAGTTQATLSLATQQNATCRYSISPEIPYDSMTLTFTTTGGTSHSRTLGGLANGNAYDFYVRCVDGAGNRNTDDFPIGFIVAHSPSVTPIASYGFEEGSGTLVADVSGRGHHGVVDGPAWNTNGRFGRSLTFDGIDDLITIDSTSLLNPLTAMTLEAWVFPTTTAGTRDIIIKEGENADVYNLYARNWQGLPESNVNIEGAPITAEGAALPANQWTHVAGTYNGSVVRLFVNGVQVAVTTQAGTVTPSAGPLRIGGNSLWGEFFQGRIDEVRVYNRALTQAEIVNDMNTAVGGTTLPDLTAPVRSNAQPVGILPSGTTQVTMSLMTNEAATCRYSLTAGVAYASMAVANTFNTSDSISHSRTLTGLTSGTSYNIYVRCRDVANNANTTDLVISFSVPGTLATATSNFGGSEETLSENGTWDSPGSWADLQKEDGAYADGVNALARLVVPAMGPSQYSEITFDQDPGSSSWVGVATRLQGAANGSGYLAIAFAGEIRLYRADDSGSLNFALLASSSAAVGAAPRRLPRE
jgi:hypothetical protein